jgi:hypothetical protein
MQSVMQAQPLCYNAWLKSAAHLGRIRIYRLYYAPILA